MGENETDRSDHHSACCGRMILPINRLELDSHLPAFLVGIEYLIGVG